MEAPSTVTAHDVLAECKEIVDQLGVKLEGCQSMLSILKGRTTEVEQQIEETATLSS